MTRSATEDEEEKGEDNDDDDASVSFGHIFVMLRTI
jgi:hypothetical protein